MWVWVTAMFACAENQSTQKSTKGISGTFGHLSSMLMIEIDLQDITSFFSSLGSVKEAVYSRCRSALGLVQLRSLGGSTARHCVDQYMVWFRYCSSRGNGPMPGGQHARLCHAFLVVLVGYRPNSAASCNAAITHIRVTLFVSDSLSVL